MKAVGRINRRSCPAQSGFTLLELLVVVLILTIMMGIVFQQVDLVQKRSRAEQSKIDAFEQARDFLDLISRDIHISGYPGSHVQNPSQISNGLNDPNNAIGLVKVDSGELRLEAPDDQGKVVAIVYQLNSGTLQRSQSIKVNDNSLTGQNVSLQTGIENVQNTAIFAAYKTDGTPVTLPVDINSSPADIASIKSIEVVLQVRGSVPDMQTGIYPSAGLRSVVRVINCSQAAAGKANSCF
jgi:prepilin-type N-terminal cleavage/methylation domain-containing protein